MSKAFTKESDGDDDEELGLPALPAGSRNYMTPEGYARLRAELFTLIAAVRMGSVMLGIGGIVGGNVFDTLMITIADVVYTPGTIYAAAGPSPLVLPGGTVLITTILALGLLVRDRRGIGFEGIAIPAVYLATVGLAILPA